MWPPPPWASKHLAETSSLALGEGAEFLQAPIQIIKWPEWEGSSRKGGGILAPAEASLHTKRQVTVCWILPEASQEKKAEVIGEPKQFASEAVCKMSS